MDQQDNCNNTRESTKEWSKNKAGLSRWPLSNENGVQGAEVSGLCEETHKHPRNEAVLYGGMD